jgi:hypothetical protein
VREVTVFLQSLPDQTSILPQETCFMKILIERAREIATECTGHEIIPDCFREILAPPKNSEQSSFSVQAVPVRWRHFSPASFCRDDVEQSLRAFFTVFNPSKLELIDEILDEYEGSYSELFDALEARYMSPAAGAKKASVTDHTSSSYQGKNPSQLASDRRCAVM